MNVQLPIAESSPSFKMYATRLEKLEIFTRSDLLMHIPFRYDDFSLVSTISTIQAGETVTIKGKVSQITSSYLRSHKTIQKAILSDETGMVEVTWFNQPFSSGTSQDLITFLPLGISER